jgi:hypothetical protein
MSGSEDWNLTGATSIQGAAEMPAGAAGTATARSSWSQTQLDDASQRLEGRSRRRPVPVPEIRRVKLAKAQGRHFRVEADRNELALLPRERSLVLDPGRLIAAGRPGDDHGPGRVELALDVLGKLRSGMDFTVPPHRPAFGLERRSQFFGRVPVCASV